MLSQICFVVVCQVLLVGWYVFLEKFLGILVFEVLVLECIVCEQGWMLFIVWYSQFVLGILCVCKWLVDWWIICIIVIWCEDVWCWYFGQDWIFVFGGVGVFDFGINVYFILIYILLIVFYMIMVELEFFENCDMFIVVCLIMLIEEGVFVDLDFDFCEIGLQIWDMCIEIDCGVLDLLQGGVMIVVGGQMLVLEGVFVGEYDCIYVWFVKLIEGGKSDVDFVLFWYVVDVMMLGCWMQIEVFDW